MNEIWAFVIGVVAGVVLSAGVVWLQYVLRWKR